MLAVITGATGLVGSNLARYLIARGVDVRCTKRSSSKIEHLAGLKIDWVEADLDDTDSLIRAFEGAEAVFHCAAQVSMWKGAATAMWKANYHGTAHILDAVRTAKVKRLVHCSSVDALGLPEGDTPATEDTPWNWDKLGLENAYARTKLESQKKVIAAARLDVDAVIVNPTFMIGPFDPKPSSGRLLLEIASGKVPGAPGGKNNFVDVRDVCAGMWAAYEKGIRGENYILGGYNMTYLEAFTMIANEAGVKPPGFVIPRILARIGGWGGDLIGTMFRREMDVNSVTAAIGYANHTFSHAKATAELGYRPESLEPAIRDAFAWFREKGML